MTLRNSSSTLFFTRKKTISTPTADTSQQVQNIQTLLSSVVASASATEAEILWTVQTAPFCVTSYDKSLNRIFEEEQMDMHLQYFKKNPSNGSIPMP